MNKKQRREHLLNIAINIALQKGYYNVLRKDIAKVANISPALINHYFKTIDNLKKEIVATAVKRGILNIIAQAISINRNRLLKLKLTPELKKEVANLITK
jgi:AcrR family transcriptional regulator